MIVVRGEEEKVRGLVGPGTQLLQICRDFPGVPDVRSMTLGEINFFYRAIIPELKKT